jgi:hypothetical protein
VLRFASHPQTASVFALGLDFEPGRILVWLVGLLAALALVLLLVVIVLFVRRSSTDPALVAGENFTLWRAPREVFWGRLEPNGRGLVLHFERPYAPAKEPRRSALVLDGRDACGSLALIRPLHLRNERAPDGDPSAARTQRAGATDPRGGLAVLVADALEALDHRLERALRSGRPQPLQERATLERWRGRRVVVELENGARLAGRLTHIGPAWLRVVDTGDVPVPTVVEIAHAASGADAPFEVRASSSSVELIAPTDVRGVAHVLDVEDGTRTWTLGVTLLPGTELILPWSGAVARDVRARAAVALGLELLVPRATARVVFASENGRSEREACA